MCVQGEGSEGEENKGKSWERRAKRRNERRGGKMWRVKGDYKERRRFKERNGRESKKNMEIHQDRGEEKKERRKGVKVRNKLCMHAWVCTILHIPVEICNGV